MAIGNVARKVLDLYGRGQYEAGLEVIAAARPDHPDQDGRLTFWQACLLGMSNRPQEALEVLEAGLDRGLWWASGMLADSDLDSVRTLPGWDDLLSRSDRVAAESGPVRLAPQVRPATTQTSKGTLIALHGAANDPRRFAKRWEEATPDSWTVIIPAGSVPIPPGEGEWGWPYDLPPEPVLEHLEGLEINPPLILSGWSQGGALAAAMAWNGALEVDGLLLVGASPREEWNPESHRHIPTYIVVGENDSIARPTCVQLGDLMTKHGVPVHLDERPGLGHEAPEDLAGTIAAALGWLVPG